MGVSTWLRTRSYSLMGTHCGCKYMVKDQVLLTHGSLHYLTKSRTLRRGMATLPRNSTFLSRSSSNTVTSKTEWISRTLLKPQYYHPTSIKNGHRQSQSTMRGRRKRRKKEECFGEEQLFTSKGNMEEVRSEWAGFSGNEDRRRREGRPGVSMLLMGKLEWKRR